MSRIERGGMPMGEPSPFHGVLRRTALMEGFRVRERSYSNGIKTPWHRHDHPYFAFTLRGESRKAYRRQSQTLDCQPGTLVFHPPDCLHQDAFQSPDVRMLQIEMEPWRANAWRHPLSQLPTAKDLGGPLLNSVLARLHDELRRLDDLSPLVIEGLVLEMLAYLFRTSTPPREGKRPPWLARAEEMVRDRFPQRLTLRVIAGEVGVHPVHLAREFRRYRGCTIGEMVRRLRIEYSCREIARSRRPLSQIALDAGFADQSHFSNTFRTVMRMTPSEFGRTYRRANAFPMSEAMAGREAQYEL